MNNLQWLYDTDETFREAVKAAGATYIGSTNLNFANTWLMERHHEEDEACLLGQHAEPEEVDSREKLEADVSAWCATFPTWNHADEFREHVFGWLDRQAAITLEECNECEPAYIRGLKIGRSSLDKEFAALQAIAEKYRADAIVAQEEIDYLKHECDEWEEDWEAMKAERDGLKRERAEMDDELDAVEKERDAYRELCGRMRKMANEMLVMEVAEC